MLYPTFLDLRTHGENFKGWQYLYRKKLVSLTYLQKNFIGSLTLLNMDPFQWSTWAISTATSNHLFFVKSIKFHVKLSYFILLTILILSFRFQILDLLWQGMHAPNMFLHRYSWIFSLTIILMAGEVLNRIEEITWIRFSLANFLLILGFGATVLTAVTINF